MRGERKWGGGCCMACSSGEEGGRREVISQALPHSAWLHPPAPVMRAPFGRSRDFLGLNRNPVTVTGNRSEGFPLCTSARDPEAGRTHLAARSRADPSHNGSQTWRLSRKHSRSQRAPQVPRPKPEELRTAQCLLLAFRETLEAQGVHFIRPGTPCWRLTFT